MLISGLLFFGIFLSIAVIALPLSIRFLAEHGMTEANYKQARIPKATGIYLLFLTLFYMWLSRIWLELELSLPFSAFAGAGSNAQKWTYAYISSLTIVFALGWMDDSIGDKTVKGFKGHLRKWRLEKSVSTGLLKAAGTALTACWISIELGGGLLAGLLHFGLIALAANAVNLLDLRPGRAIKSFWAAAVLIFAAGEPFAAAAWLFPLLVGTLLLLPDDLGGRAMLGDTGANLLGFALGTAAAASAPWWFQTGMLAGLIAIHWVAERGSVTRIIENSRLLNWLDKLGRV
ncbi:hypothetical protein [Ferviditalea candida]|uniref:Glycosyl transferase family 4 n=1 Tax=Ferviditalea candida TaxID=3108399 RepID=A0ABU5ZLX4_9BACL|nr:hypothetical protein [Paenibacillaceae bacterium T2]